MNWLKRLPIHYIGRLQDVRLINFSVDIEEVKPLVPAELSIRNFNGRAVISMVNVHLRHMRPKGLPKALGFHYQHIGFRLLIDDAHLNKGEAKGIYFLRSFTDTPWVAKVGNWMTHYRLSKARIEDPFNFELTQGDQFLRYRLTHEQAEQDDQLKAMIQAVDRAYAVDYNSLLKTQIQREQWPIQWVGCEGFETNFFKSARFLGAFEVPEVIDYEWLPPEKVLVDSRRQMLAGV